MKNKFLTSRDYAKLFERAKRILDREISKPSDEWDEGLIEELEETMLYCAERKKVLLSEEKQSRRLQPSFKLRRALVIVAAVLASFVIFATVAQAAGFRVWSAIVHWDINYLRIDYVDYAENTSDNPNAGTSSNDNTPIEVDDAVVTEYYSINELKDAVGTDVLILEGDYEQAFQNATFVTDGLVANIRSEYIVSEKTITIVVVTATDQNEDLSSSIIKQGGHKNVYEKEVEGVLCVFGDGSESSICTFRYGEFIYRISGKTNAEDLESIVEYLLKGSEKDEN